MKKIQDYFNSMLSYDPDTGVLTWKHREPPSKSNNTFNSLYANKVVGFLKASNKSKTTYLGLKIEGKYYSAHRVIFAMMAGYMPNEVDHIDHNGLNNKWGNLRASNRTDNSKNLPMQKSNKSGHIGVNWHKSAKKWQARAVNLEGKRVDLGRYDNIEDAIAVRKKYEKEFGYYNNRSAV